MKTSVYRNRAGAGEYTQSERTWIKIFKYLGMLCLGAGLFCAFFTAVHPIIWAVLLVLGVASLTLSVRIIRRGYARYQVNAEIRRTKNHRKKH